MFTILWACCHAFVTKSPITEMYTFSVIVYFNAVFSVYTKKTIEKARVQFKILTKGDK